LGWKVEGNLVMCKEDTSIICNISIISFLAIPVLNLFLISIYTVKLLRRLVHQTLKRRSVYG